jgi:hypothetical protein
MMKGWAVERWAAAAGVGYVVLSLVGNFAPGESFPKFDASSATTAAYVYDHHRALAIGAILTGLAAPLLIWMFAALAGMIRDAGAPTLAVVVVATAVAGTTLAAAGEAMLQVLSRVGDETFVKSMYQVSAFMISKAFWCAAVGAFVVSWAAMDRGVLPRWFAWMSLAGSVVFALGGASVAHKGFFAPAGGMAVIAFIVLLVWVLASSYVLWAASATERAPMPATSPL